MCMHRLAGTTRSLHAQSSPPPVPTAVVCAPQQLEHKGAGQGHPHPDEQRPQQQDAEAQQHGCKGEGGGGWGGGMVVVVRVLVQIQLWLLCWRTRKKHGAKAVWWFASRAQRLGVEVAAVQPGTAVRRLWVSRSPIRPRPGSVVKPKLGLLENSVIERKSTMATALHREARGRGREVCRIWLGASVRPCWCRGPALGAGRCALQPHKRGLRWQRGPCPRREHQAHGARCHSRQALSHPAGSTPLTRSAPTPQTPGCTGWEAPPPRQAPPAWPPGRWN